MKRSPMSPRSVPLVSTAALQRGPGPSRNVPLRSVSPARAREGAARGTTLKAPARNPNGPTGEVRDRVLKRDEHTCQCGCLQSIVGQRYSLGHRLRASQGGQAIPSNLLTFLGWGGEQHHGRIDRRDDPQDELNGMTVRSGQDPAQVPIAYTREDGSKVERFLWDDGTRRDYPQAKDVAA